MKIKLENVNPDLSYPEWEEAIDKWCLDKTNRELLKKHFLDGKSYYELAEEFNYDSDTVKRRIKLSRERVFSHTKKAGK